VNILEYSFPQPAAAGKVSWGGECCDATSIPIIGDGDGGYGGVLNVRRTLRG
jgi:isocitrate lyase